MMPRPYDPPLGAGESASVPSAAAIANAVFDATGIRFRELPITSDKLREALNGPDAERQAAPPKKRSAANGGSAERRGCSARCWASRAAPCRGGRRSRRWRRPAPAPGRPPRWSAAASWPPPETARFAIPHRKGDQRRRAGDGDAARHALQHQHYPGRGNRHRQLVVYRVRSGDAPGHRPRRPPSVSGISLHRIQ